jgi:hypothetical protein
MMEYKAALVLAWTGSLDQSTKSNLEQNVGRAKVKQLRLQFIGQKQTAEQQRPEFAMVVVSYIALAS